MRLNPTTRRRVLTAAVAALAAVSAACGAEKTTPPPDDLRVDWDTFAVNCDGGPGDWEEIMELDPGELLTLENPAEQLNTSGCRTTRRHSSSDPDGREAWDDPDRLEGRTWYAVGTRADRFGVRGAIHPDGTATIVEVTHTTVGENCATTTDWRGALTLIIDAPADEPAPQIEYRTDTQPCD